MLLANRAELLLLDEPTAGMTAEETSATGELIRMLAGSHNLSLIIIEHDINFIRDLKAPVTVLHLGRSWWTARSCLAELVPATSTCGMHQSLRAQILPPATAVSRRWKATMARMRRRTACVGRNGMGKTTLIRCLAGLLPSWHGSISLDGEDVTRLPAHERARRGLTTIVQGRGLFPRLTVRENLEMGRIAGGGGKRSHLDEVIGYFPRLGERLGQAAGTLSGGEQQMLSIGCGLMTHPRLMLLDEPSDGINAYPSEPDRRDFLAPGI